MRDIPEFHLELINRISKKNDFINNNKSKLSLTENNEDFMNSSQKQKPPKGASTLIPKKSHVKLLPDNKTFEYLIPYLLIVADRDVIDKFQEEIMIRNGLLKLKENCILNMDNI